MSTFTAGQKVLVQHDFEESAPPWEGTVILVEEPHGTYVVRPRDGGPAARVFGIDMTPVEDAAKTELSISAGQALDALRVHMRLDGELAWGWACSVAQAMSEQGLDHAAANRGAACFMQAVFGVDITERREYREIKDILPSGAQLITVERQNQAKKYGPSHDDHHKSELLLAAMCYTYAGLRAGQVFPSAPIASWPWQKSSWHPSEDRITNLIKAGALIAAEIDRLQREQERK